MNSAAPRWDRTLSLPRTGNQKLSTVKRDPLSQLNKLSHTSDALTSPRNQNIEPQSTAMRTTRSAMKSQGGLVGLTRTVSGVVKRRKHVVLLGLDGSGKTTILMRLKYGCQVATVPTIGFNHEKVWGGGFRWSAWDVGGGEKLRPLWVMYARATDGLVFVVDASSNNDVIEESRVELSRVVKASKTSAQTLNVAPPPVLVLANFQDRSYARGPEDIALCLGLSEPWAAGIMWAVAPVCGLTGEGLEEALNTLRALIDGTKKERRKADKGGGPKGPPRWRW